MTLNAVDKAFHETYTQLLNEGHLKQSRTGVDTLMLPAMMMRFDCGGGKMPILSTRKVFTRSFIREMLWFISGNSSIKYLRDANVGIWDDWFIPGTDKYDEAAAPISLKKRLSRVSKNDSERWTQIRRNLSEFHDEAGGVEMSLPIWSGTRFVDTDINYEQVNQLWICLNKLKVPAYPLLDADIGPGGYGPQWRHWQDTQLIDRNLLEEYEVQGYQFVTRIDTNEDFYDKVVVHREIDQLQNCIDKLRSNPDDRRILVTAWNPGLTWRAALPPCHLYYQFVSRLLSDDERQAIASRDESSTEGQEVPTRALTLYLTLRSNDTPLGAVFNVAQYALLLHMVAQTVGMEPGEFISVAVDSHCYSNQVEQIKELLTRESPADSHPKVVFTRKISDIDDFKFEDIEIIDYFPLSKIDIPVAV